MEDDGREGETGREKTGIRGIVWKKEKMAWKIMEGRERLEERELYRGKKREAWKFMEGRDISRGRGNWKMGNSMEERKEGMEDDGRKKETGGEGTGRWGIVWKKK